MDFAGERTYKLNQILLTVIGLWPYNNTAFRQLQRIFCPLIFAVSICLQLGRIIRDASDLESVFEILSFSLPCLVFSLKYATFCIETKNVKKLIEQMKYNWNIIKCREEVQIFQQYADVGYLLSIFFLMIFFVCMFTFFASQILPKVLDIIMPLNESRPCELLGLATLFFDQEKYFVPILIHMFTALFVELCTLVATEAMLIIYMQHCCALFKIASFRIEHVFDCELKISVTEQNKKYHANIVDAVIVHNRAIEYFEFLHSVFETSYFILLVLGVCSLSVNLFYFCVTGFAKEMKKALATGMIVFVHFVYMFVGNFLGQIMTNHSLEIFYKTCDLPWYSVPVQLQKLLQFIMHRSMISCKFTLGSIFDGSLECFASLMSVSLSYFTVFWSMRH